MARITVSTTIGAPPEVVWEVVEDVASHVEWMTDAVAIRFTSDRTRGVGTTFECDTRVGPLRLTDEMEITEWAPGRLMGVRHVGLVTGEGAFRLAPIGGGSNGGGSTRFQWHERLVFPWWMGGPLGALVGGRLLALVWRRNLGALRELVEQRGSPDAT